MRAHALRASLPNIWRSDTAALMLANLATVALGFITGVITARALGPSGRGDLAVVLFWPSALTSLLDAPIMESVAIRTARDPDRGALSAGSGLFVAIAGSIVAGAIGWIVMPLLLRESQQGLLTLARVALLFVPCSLLSSVPLGFLLGRQRYRAVALIRVGNVLLYGASLATLLVLDVATVTAVMWLTVAARLIPLIACAAPKLRVTKAWPGRDEIAGHVREAGSIQGARTAFVLSSSQDRVLANWTLTQTSIGHWQVVAALVSVMPFVSQAVSQKLLANVAKHESGSSPAVYAAYVRAVVVTAGVAGLTMLFTPVLVPALYGEEFAAAVWPSIIAALGTIASAGTLVLQVAGRAARRTRETIESEVLASAAMAAAAIPLTSAFGIVGLASALLLGRGIALAWASFRIAPSLQMRCWNFVPLSYGFLFAAREEWRSLTGKSTRSGDGAVNGAA